MPSYILDEYHALAIVESEDYFLRNYLKRKIALNDLFWTIEPLLGLWLMGSNPGLGIDAVVQNPI